MAAHPKDSEPIHGSNFYAKPLMLRTNWPEDKGSADRFVSRGSLAPDMRNAFSRKPLMLPELFNERKVSPDDVPGRWKD
jgi:hypothetical protein